MYREVGQPLLASALGVLAVVRAKLRVAIATVIVAWLIAFGFAERIARVLAAPLLEAWSHGGHADKASLHYGALVEPFWAYLNLSFWVAIVLASPVLFFQIWRLIAPRLPARHRRLGVPFAAVCGVCFVGGVVFGYLFVLPLGYHYLLTYAGENLATMNAASDLGGAIALRPTLFVEPYLALTTRMLVAFGVVFEMPVFLVALAWLGLIDHRALWRFNRWAIVLAFVVGAVLTPGPDLVSQVLMALPLIALYNLSIVAVWLIVRRRAAATASG
jgi:sec-independent protein translocase protein TatC